MRETQLSILFWAYLISAGITTFLSFYVRRFTKSPSSKAFSYLLSALTVWALTVVFGMTSLNEDAGYFFAILRMIAVIAVPVFWFVFALEFTDRRELLKKRWLQPVLMFSLFSILILLTNEYHKFFITGIDFQFYGKFLDELQWHLGPYYWIHLIYTYGLILAGVTFILQKAVGMQHKFRNQSIALIFGSLIPLIGNIILIWNLIPQLKAYYDVIGFMLAGAAFAWAIRRDNMFDLKPIARNILIDSMMDGMLVIDESQRIIDINPAAQNILGLQAAASIGADAKKIFYPKVEIENLIDSKAKVSIDWKVENLAEGKIFELQISPIDNKGTNLGHLITLRDVTEQRNFSKKLQEIAVTDSLTGVFNQRYFYEVLETELERTKRLKKNLSLIIFDIDHFKVVNDTHGHLVGDQILKELTSVCGPLIRTYDTFARYGGEEFAFILPETGAEEAQALAERIRLLIADHTFPTAAGEITITISSGVSWLSTAENASVEDIFRTADQALYASKRAGRNRTTVMQCRPNSTNQH